MKNTLITECTDGQTGVQGFKCPDLSHFAVSLSVHSLFTVYYFSHCTGDKRQIIFSLKTWIGCKEKKNIILRRLRNMPFPIKSTALSNVGTKVQYVIHCPDFFYIFRRRYTRAIEVYWISKSVLNIKVYWILKRTGYWNAMNTKILRILKCIE